MTLPREWYSLDEAAEYMSVSKRTIYKWTKQGRLRTCLLGTERTRRFRKDDLDRLPRLLETRNEAARPETLAALSAASDPVLGELWDNEKDAAYDTL